ncbi:uncharacterized protein PV07_10514 [Cladophialophora immunda]|uniref:CCHC-type domain-containing protein n=1 Tax=Cladophialophora immunda TaxID=569365 RepID=A0A0D2CMM9_9EURO|nr:uncharacterized protein PV07_10514 [Cladophialophora immunda]KIW24824.1 hypothetical protein PV07_10514 [Cladophialophora immunda]
MVHLNASFHWVMELEACRNSIADNPCLRTGRLHFPRFTRTGNSRILVEVNHRSLWCFQIAVRIASKFDYYQGLKDSVKDRMGMDRPNEYKLLVELSIETDNWLYERQLERKGTYTGGMTYKNKQYHGDPMDLDMIQRKAQSRAAQGKYQRNGNNKTRGLPQSEREKRKKNGLCYECGTSGHRAKECKNGPTLHMMDDGIAGCEETKANTSQETQMAADSQSNTAQMDHPGTESHKEIGGSQKEEIPKEGATLEEQERQQKLQHSLLSWTACYDDSCTAHYSEKMGSGWFPRRPKKARKTNSLKRQEAFIINNEDADNE